MFDWEDLRQGASKCWLAVHEDVRATPRIKAVTDFLE